MPEGTPGSAFGFNEVDGVDPVPESSGIFDENAPQAPHDQDPARPGTPEPEETEAASQEVPAEGKFMGGRYQSLEDWEKGHRELEKTFSQTRMELTAQQKQYEQDRQEWQTFMQLAAPMLTEQLTAQDPELAEQLALAERINPILDARLGPQQEAQQQQAEQQQAQQARQVAASQFYSNHPEIVPNSDDDRQLAQQVSQVFQELQLADDDPDAYEVAYEAVRDPALRFVLQASPHYVETDAGMTKARFDAQQLAQQASQSAPTSQAGGPAQQRVRIPFVEHGGSGAPTQGAPGQLPGPLDAAKRLYDSERSSPFLR
jgi:hypothetical protein